MDNKKAKKRKEGPQRKPFFTAVKSFLRIFKRKPKIVNLNDEPLADTAIYTTNHEAAKGPLIYELYFPKNFRFWGTHEMTADYKTRYKYLSTTYLNEKKHIPKWLSKILAVIIEPFVHAFYKGIQLIPTYRDTRLFKTFKTTFNELDNGTSILIFPENSSDGYHQELTEYYAGFVTLAKQYYKTRKKNLKIYNMYYCKSNNTIVIDKAIDIKELLDQGKSDKEIAEEFRVRANELYHTYKELPKSKRKEKKEKLTSAKI